MVGGTIIGALYLEKHWSLTKRDDFKNFPQGQKIKPMRRKL